MPHDLKGNIVEIGQEVSIPARVIAVQEGDEYCNCTVETLNGMMPSGSKQQYALNTKQVEVTKEASWREKEITT